MSFSTNCVDLCSFFPVETVLPNICFPKDRFVTSREGPARLACYSTFGADVDYIDVLGSGSSLGAWLPGFVPNSESHPRTDRLRATNDASGGSLVRATGLNGTSANKEPVRSSRPIARKCELALPTSPADTVLNTHWLRFKAIAGGHTGDCSELGTQVWTEPRTKQCEEDRGVHPYLRSEPRIPVFDAFGVV